MKIVVYDTEIYPNLLLYIFYDIELQQYFEFEISPFRDNRKELITYLKTVSLMVGFNNISYDYPLLHLLINLLNKNFKTKGKDIVKAIKAKSDSIFKSKRYAHEIYNPLIPQLDLYKIHHFDNQAKTTSLKMLEFVFRMSNVAELPYPPNTVLTEEQAQKVREYCKKDVFATTDTFNKTQQAIELRTKLSAIYGLPMSNWNDPKIGENILMKLIRQKLNIYDLGKTPRSSIDIGKILFDYINFNSKPFQAIHGWFKNRIITETKKVFGELPMSEIEDLIPYANTTKKNMVKGKLKTLNVIFNGFQYNFGLGGIHGSIESGVYESNSEYTIIDIDVKGFYPNESIKNRLYPQHLTEVFCDVLEIIGIEREKYAKKTPENTGLKLAGNGAYGKSNSPYSPLYDPQYTMSVTINGQLLLCMISEWLSIIPDLLMIQANTDGITVRIKRVYEGLLHIICNRWETLTNLNFEYSQYNKMVIRDVNNYLAIDNKGNIKLKGAFEIDRELHKNHSMLIIPKTIKSYYVDSIPIEQTIMNGDPWDFFKRVKLNDNGKLVGRSDTDENQYGKITRYYVSEFGETLIKILPPLKKVTDREFNIEAGYICTVANIVDDDVLIKMKQNINYQYYINECNKIVNAINNHLEIPEENE